MRLCVATTSVPGDLFQKLEEIARTGFSGIELYEPDLTGSAANVTEIGRRAKALGLAVEVFQPFHDFEGLTGSARELAFARLDQKLDLMSALGAKTLLVGTSTHPSASGDVDAICADLTALAERAGQAGCRAALLALPWAQHVKSEAEALRLVDAVDSPHLGLALNSFFSLADGSRPARLRDIPGQRLFHVQLSDAPILNFDISRLKSHFGRLPGQGGLNLDGFVRVIARSGYDGPWSLARVSDTAQGSRKTYARDGFRALVSLLDRAAQSEPSLVPPLPNLPPPVYPKGIEFVEFATDAGSHATLTEMLGSLCFRKEHQHVSKSVELWRQGAINLVINAEVTGFAADAFAEHGPTVCDMGLRVSDAAQTVARATRLGAPEFSQPVGTGELDIPAIKGVGGSVVHFIDEKSDLHRVWDIEFDAVPKTEAIPPAGLRRIDHIAQTMRYQEMQSWLTYYTSTFEMEKAPVVDVADPSGVILSQALASPEGEVRFNLNGAGERRTFAGAFLADQIGAGVQHIAFLTDDIFETSAHLRAAGFQRLEMPGNYYDNLAVTFPLDSDLIDQLRAGHILYDRAGGAEYFQIYSAPIFRGFFFEIVQRKGGYQGYGARNAPIRLAAQMHHLQERQA
ncbi:bifunctional sugar phosphate isomerase/epimerase/4-hydroxyphenylpyruvate dioxygenase family protein [Ruegeria lacuscaerulensis]|uniref:bifunctional sugar phosphate isomerase/epimerase/4-hydroxyphenylpyruvate dioxygenase family protein n=1 Tax=Ruegeria lacuscaerulensis TaxID=55218 RepID=UPI00147BB9B4|nr:sugar phosphate isomerase/epimerase and 4-hydroxyphenylpyruvate domain-containing protein [Ruegeria lacuscaerulensis]